MSCAIWGDSIVGLWQPTPKEKNTLCGAALLMVVSMVSIFMLQRHFSQLKQKCSAQELAEVVAEGVNHEAFCQLRVIGLRLHGVGGGVKNKFPVPRVGFVTKQ